MISYAKHTESPVGFLDIYQVRYTEITLLILEPQFASRWKCTEPLRVLFQKMTNMIEILGKIKLLYKKFAFIMFSWKLYSFIFFL